MLSGQSNCAPAGGKAVELNGTGQFASLDAAGLAASGRPSGQ